ncbi:MAG: DNA-3-methyladenine glycosylase 2 family protein [Clostridiales bacterium]|uniref:DNA-3-methyladenine glycosylase family protein n=1 Tax=Clostridium sp. N3C TaxID=1776758 RepID=UPI00092E1E0B|nr:DNA-3-methyladenine glycosylase [Clostridium sp. N3C]NLZ48159.1 DNA-3-methyladenine glycosylase 2 family protein [Clostridiales bacterium]SCN22502.1 DNA-3-methyladenine glycosylase [Clostridium sp. N3C]
MDYKDIEVKDNYLIIKDVENFDPVHIFECGQCFRWNKVSDNDFIGVAYGKVIEVVKEGKDVIIYNSTEEDFYNIWCEYFDLKRNYSEIKEELSKDPLLKQAVDFGYGIRILKQEPFEIVISFIISANNRIPMIKRCIENISRRWGEQIEYNGVIYYAFPSPEKLATVSEEELESCGLGFRAKYVKDTVSKIYNSLKGVEGFENYNIYNIANMVDDDCHKALQQFNGIGPKVADCIMLFSMNKISAFPVDVWVKRAMMHFYTAPDLSLKKIRDFAREKFGHMSGFAQQYLFYYARENNIKID